jgi:hypothetical protein
MPMPMADELNLGGLIDPTSDRDAIAFSDLAGSQADGDGRVYSRGEIGDLANAVARGLRARPRPWRFCRHSGRKFRLLPHGLYGYHARRHGCRAYQLSPTHSDDCPYCGGF